MNYLKRHIFRIKRNFEFFWWGVKISMKYNLGRLYIFRDAPLHVVLTYASFLDHPEEGDEDILTMAAMALDEFKLRTNRMLRDHGVEDRI